MINSNLRNINSVKSLAYWTLILKKRGCRFHICKPLEEGGGAIRTRCRRLCQWHVGPAFVKVSHTMVAGNFRPKTWLDFSTLQFLPVDGRAWTIYAALLHRFPSHHCQADCLVPFVATTHIKFCQYRDDHTIDLESQSPPYASPSCKNNIEQSFRK